MPRSGHNVDVVPVVERRVVVVIVVGGGAVVGGWVAANDTTRKHKKCHLTLLSLHSFIHSGLFGDMKRVPLMLNRRSKWQHFHKIR